MRKRDCTLNIGSFLGLRVLLVGVLYTKMILTTQALCLRYQKWQKAQAKITKVEGFQYGCLALNTPSYFITGTIFPVPHTDAKTEGDQSARI